MSADKDGTLYRVMGLLAERLALLEESTDVVECVAQGKLEVAREAVKAAASLLGEDRT